jgi:hypothetical protein
MAAETIFNDEDGMHLAMEALAEIGLKTFFLSHKFDLCGTPAAWLLIWGNTPLDIDAFFALVSTVIEPMHGWILEADGPVTAAELEQWVRGEGRFNHGFTAP